jgi:hypothetical protein
MSRPRLAVAAALAVSILVPATALTAQATPAAPASSHQCDRVAYALGDSRRTLEHEVLPKTTDLVWARQLGIVGERHGRTTTHVRYLAEPGVVHARFAEDLAGLMAACSKGERPLVFDFMGTNYGVQTPERIGDPTFYRDVEQTIRDFYADNAPNALVVLAELTLNRTMGDAAYQAGVTGYLDGYNGALRDLAATDPQHFFFLPAPAIYDGAVTWRDGAHETSVAPMATYLAGGDSGALDRAGVAMITGAHNDTCALLQDDRFASGDYSEGTTLGAYLQDFRRSPIAQRWLAAKDIPANARIDLDAKHVSTCDY